MPKTDAQTMVVRLPVEIARDLMKLRNENNLSTVGSALKYWIEQQNNEKIEARLNLIEEQNKKMTKILDRLLNALFKMDKRTQERLNSLEANELQKVK